MQPILPVAVHGLSRAVKHKMMQHLRNREKRVHGNGCSNITMEDVEEVVQEVSLVDGCMYVCVTK